jgi:hypothetical protein
VGIEAESRCAEAEKNEDFVGWFLAQRQVNRSKDHLNFLWYFYNPFNKNEEIGINDAFESELDYASSSTRQNDANDDTARARAMFQKLKAISAPKGSIRIMVESFSIPQWTSTETRVMVLFPEPFFYGYRVEPVMYYSPCTSCSKGGVGHLVDRAPGATKIFTYSPSHLEALLGSFLKNEKHQEKDTLHMRDGESQDFYMGFLFSGIIGFLGNDWGRYQIPLKFLENKSGPSHGQ